MPGAEQAYRRTTDAVRREMRRPAPEHQNNGVERDKARDAESWRRGRAMAWDDYVQVALAEAGIPGLLETGGQNLDQVIDFTCMIADRLLAERDRRFGS